jgi:8-oxo-dGTP pyrophosphatase MutT (NUDIX family)
MQSEQNPWKTLSRKTVYTNPWMSVREDKVIRPDGQEGIYGIVETRTATGVVALTQDDHVVLVGQYRYPTETYSWEIVEGGADAGEDPMAAATRELQEEAGLIAADWAPLGSEIHLSNCITSEKGFLYVAWNLSETAASPEGTEVLQVKTVPLAEALGMVHDGEITDAMSIMGLMRVEHWLKNRG